MAGRNGFSFDESNEYIRVMEREWHLRAYLQVLEQMLIAGGMDPLEVVELRAPWRRYDPIVGTGEDWDRTCPPGDPGPPSDSESEPPTPATPPRAESKPPPPATPPKKARRTS